MKRDLTRRILRRPRLPRPQNLEHKNMKGSHTILGVVTAFILIGVSASTPGASVSNEPTQENKAEKAAEKTKDAVVKGATVAVDKTKEALSKTGEVITDEWITTRVHARFVDEVLLKDSDISVDADKHVVTLKGTVRTKAGRTRAARIAKGTEGVRTVVNHLIVGPKIGS
jgi:osmotically-inducible protein OsmY